MENCSDIPHRLKRDPFLLLSGRDGQQWCMIEAVVIIELGQLRCVFSCSGGVMVGIGVQRVCLREI